MGKKSITLDDKIFDSLSKKEQEKVLKSEEKFVKNNGNTTKQ